MEVTAHYDYARNTVNYCSLMTTVWLMTLTYDSMTYDFVRFLKATPHPLAVRVCSDNLEIVI